MSKMCFQVPTMVRTTVRLTMLLLLLRPGLRAEDMTRLTADRLAVEHVYYNHRLGAKPPFAQIMPAALAEELVREDLHKQAVLKSVYGIDISPARLAAEISRIDQSTRAPAMLAELKAALGNDPNRFAEAVVKPILVERMLREKFDNDDALHAPQRLECETMRAALLEAKANGATPAQLLAQLQRAGSNAVQVLTWQLAPRPARSNAPSDDQIKSKRRFEPGARIVSSPREAEAEQTSSFEDLSPQLQRVLRVQLRQPGDMSAVIEMPGGFLLYVATKKTEKVLSAGCLFLPKTGFEQWLNQQKDML
jgi:hypothetical protein